MTGRGGWQGSSTWNGTANRSGQFASTAGMTNEEMMTKHEIRLRNTHAGKTGAVFGLRISDLFRASDFGFRVSLIIPLGVLLLSASPSHGQTTTNAPATTNSPPPAIEEDTGKWSFSASVYGYLVPDSRDYAQPTITADRGWLHFEARYNYEALDTGSAWLGYNFSGGKKLEWEVTPMLGGVFGDMTGVAPGYKGSLRWWKLELYSEGEYVFDTRDSSGSYFYNWSELSLAPVDWFRFGLVTQRTRAYQTDRELQRGVLAGVSFKKLSFTTYVFNPDESRPTLVLAAGLSF